MVIKSANSSFRACSKSKARRRISARSRAGVDAHESAAATAASKAAIPSSGVASAITRTTSPVAGSCTANVAFDDAARQ